jgi:hypothetical protein
VQLKDIWRKNATGKSPRGSYSCTTMPRLSGYMQPRKNWPTRSSNVLITHPINRIWPRRTTTYSLDWKKTIVRSKFFVGRGGHCCRCDLVGRTSFWFFWVACRIQSNGLRSVLSFVRTMLNKSRVWSL